jgi:WD40 repeat protein
MTDRLSKPRDTGVLAKEQNAAEPTECFDVELEAALPKFGNVPGTSGAGASDQRSSHWSLVRIVRKCALPIRAFNKEIKPFTEFLSGLATIVTFVGLLVAGVAAVRSNKSQLVVTTQTSATDDPVLRDAPSTSSYPSTSVAGGFEFPQVGTSCLRPERRVSTMALSSVGAFAAGTETGYLGVADRSCDAMQQIELSRVNGPRVYVTALAFSDDGSKLFVATLEKSDGKASSYIGSYLTDHIDAGPSVRTPSLAGDISALRLGMGGILYSAGETVRAWSPLLVSMHEGVGPVDIDDARINGLAVTTDSTGASVVFALGSQGVIFRVSPDTWRAKKIGVCGPSSYDIAATKDHVIVVGQNCILVVDHFGNRPKDGFNFSEVGFPAGFTPLTVAAVDGPQETVIVGGGRPPNGPGMAVVWNPSTGVGGPLKVDSSTAVRSVAVSPDGRSVAVDADNRPTVWSLPTP